MCLIDILKKCSKIDQESCIYSRDGIITTFSGENIYHKGFFRKMLDLTDKGHRNERIIAQMLLENPQRNVIKVLGIGQFHIDYQKVDTTKKINFSNKQIKKDIRNGLNNLHHMGIIHLDLRDDNLGYDHQAKEWVIFDFDLAGIFDVNNPNQWLDPGEPLIWHYNHHVYAYQYFKSYDFVQKIIRNPKKYCLEKGKLEKFWEIDLNTKKKYDQILFLDIFGENL